MIKRKVHHTVPSKVTRGYIKNVIKKNNRNAPLLNKEFLSVIISLSALDYFKGGGHEQP